MLPIDDYLIVNGNQFTQDSQQVQAFFSTSDSYLFAVRAVPLDQGLTVQRALGITKSQVKKYVDAVARWTCII